MTWRFPAVSTSVDSTWDFSSIIDSSFQPKYVATRGFDWSCGFNHASKIAWEQR
jgi:hypothetical protein